MLSDLHTRLANTTDMTPLISVFGEQYTPDEIQRVISRGMKHATAGTGGVWVACLSGEIIGVIALSPWQRTGELSDVAVLPAYRRHGVATCLIGQTLAYARQVPYPIIELTCFADNTPALRLYEKFGFGVDRSLTLMNRAHVVMRLRL